MKQTILTSAVLASLPLLAACGSDSDDDDLQPQMTRFSLAVSDAPVNEAKVVMLCFSEIELTGNGIPDQSFTVGDDDAAAEANDECRDPQGTIIPNTRGVDLLLLDGAKSEALLTDADIEAGNYGQLRLEIAPGSYVELEDGMREPLQVPSNELKLGSLTLVEGGNANYTLEFDLRKALINPPGQNAYLMKPTGLRLVNNTEVGHLTGQVAEGLLINNNCAVAPSDASVPVAAVYLYQGADRPLDELADNGGDNIYQPYASTNVYFDGVSEYHYSIGFIQADNYTVALSCDVDDNPEAADDIGFLQAKNVVVSPTATPVEVDFMD